MLRARARLALPELCSDAGGKGRVRGSFRRRHHLGADGVYRGVRYFLPKTDLVGPDEE